MSHDSETGEPPAQRHVPNNGTITTWLVDTRTLWPGTKITTAPGAAEAMALVSPAEQDIITKKMFIADARMSLASALLKRLFICQTLRLAWNDVNLGKKGDPKHGKPCAVDASGQPVNGMDFNISHQNGLVALIGWTGRIQHKSSPSNGSIDSAKVASGVTVGVDITCVHERNDYRTIDAEGFDGWIDVFEYVFSEQERWSMKYEVDYVTLPDGVVSTRNQIGHHERDISRRKEISLTTPEGKAVKFSTELLIEAKLRRFYAYFCYKEAYIKLSGEALLAPWIKELEFTDVRSPRPVSAHDLPMNGAWGEVVEDVQTNLHRKAVQDVKMRIQAFEDNFMIATAVQGMIEELRVPDFLLLDLQTDIVDYASAHLNEP